MINMVKVGGQPELKGTAPNYTNIFIAKKHFNRVKKHYILMPVFPH
jgi:hypothetical protein